jgi:chromosome segregation ATPase
MSTFGVGSVKYIHKARDAAAPVCERAPRAKKAAARPQSELETAAKSEDRRAREAYEEARVAFEQLASNYRAVEAELQAGAQRMTRMEVELKKEREKSGSYLAQIGKHDAEVRNLREAKAAVERINSQMARPSADLQQRAKNAEAGLAKAVSRAEAAESKLAAAARRADTAEAALASTARRADNAESKLAAAARRADTAEAALASAARRADGADAKLSRQPAADAKVQACVTMLRHVDAVLDVCASGCKEAGLGTAIRDTQDNLKLFCSSI